MKVAVSKSKHPSFQQRFSASLVSGILKLRGGPGLGFSRDTLQAKSGYATLVVDIAAAPQWRYSRRCRQKKVSKDRTDFSFYN